MRSSETMLLAAAQVPGNVVPDWAQMATTLGFHIILACFGIALPSIVLLAEFIGLRRGNQMAMRLARRWSQAMGVLIAVGAVTGTVLSFEMSLLWPGLMRRYGAVLGVPFGVEGLFFFLEAIFAGIYLYGWRPRYRGHRMGQRPVGRPAAGGVADPPVLRRHGGPRMPPAAGRAVGRFYADGRSRDRE
jgi:cytochrome d ubiquinol oxidase subunit I